MPKPFTNGWLIERPACGITQNYRSDDRVSKVANLKTGKPVLIEPTATKEEK